MHDREGHKENDPPPNSISCNQVQQVHTENDLANYSEVQNKKASIPADFTEGTPGVAGGEGTLTLLTHSLTHTHTGRKCMLSLKVYKHE